MGSYLAANNHSVLNRAAVLAPTATTMGRRSGWSHRQVCPSGTAVPPRRHHAAPGRDDGQVQSVLVTDPTMPAQVAEAAPKSIRRAMPTVHSKNVHASREFYVDFLGFGIGMDQQDFLMLRSPTTPTTQLIIAGEAAPDRQVSQIDISLEVEDVDAVFAEAQRRGLNIVYPLTDEPWGIRRFFLRDPDGLVINVASHRPPT